MIASLHVRVLADTGPLVAILDEADAQHAACINALGRIRPPLLTTWPVVTEAAWLLRHRPQALQRLYTGVDDGLLQIVQLDEATLSIFAAIKSRFRSLDLQLADMSLVWLAEQQRLNTIFTLDRRDFDVIRKKSHRPLVLLP